MLSSRSPFLVVVVAAVLGIATAVFVQSQLRAAGASREVVVAARPVPAGRVLQADDVRRVAVPVAALPSAPLPSALPTGRTTTVDLAPGEVLQNRRLGVGGVAALVPAGQVAMGVTRTDAMPPLTVGLRVDVLSGADLIAGDAAVVAVDEQRVMVAVPAGVAPQLARASTERSVVLAVRGSAPG